MHRFRKKNQEEGFKTREALLKKTRNVEKHLPKNETRAAQVVQQLSLRHPAAPCNPGSTSAEKKPLTSEEKQVLDFYQSEENIVILPGKRDYVVRKDEKGRKVKLQKHILKDSKDKAYEKFKV